MADNRNKSITGSADIASSVQPTRTVGGDVKITILGHDVYLDRYVNQCYRSMQYSWASVHYSSPLPFTAEELKRYFVTALHCRVARVTHAFRSNIPFDGWALPATMAGVVAGVGEVSFEVPLTRLTPEFNVAFLGLVLDRSEWSDLTMRIRSTSDAFTKFLFVETIERDRKGRADVMALWPVMSEADVVTEPATAEVRRDSRSVDSVVAWSGNIDGRSAAIALIAGVVPDGWGSLSRIPTFALPHYSIPGHAAELVIDRLGEVKSA